MSSFIQPLAGSVKAMGDTSRLDLPVVSLRSMPYAEARERAISVLTNRYAEAAMSEAQFEWWLQRLTEADTVVRLDALVSQLTMPDQHELMPMPDAPIHVPPESRIAAFMSGTKRTGPWSLPHRLLVRAVMREVNLDLRQARIPFPCAIDVSAVMAKVRITVPPGVAVDFDVTSIMAESRNDAADWQVGPMGPRILVRGSAIMAEVRAVVRAQKYA